MMKLVELTLPALLLATLVTGETKGASAGGIVVRLSGFASDRGAAVCALFKKEGWLLAGKGERRKAEIRERAASCEFESVPYGTYAFAAFHDEDGDGEFDKRVGIPVEDYCFSNRAVPRRMQPPTFDAAKFEHAQARTRQPCELR